MTDGDRHLARLAAQQGSLLSWRQARCHLTKRQIEHRIANGLISPERRGVYRWAGASTDKWHELRVAVMAAGEGAAASHKAAAVLWGMPGVVSERPEILVPAPLWVRQPGVTCHQSGRFPEAHRAVRHGIPVTTPARVIVDLA